MQVKEIEITSYSPVIGEDGIEGLLVRNGSEYLLLTGPAVLRLLGETPTKRRSITVVPPLGLTPTKDVTIVTPKSRRGTYARQKERNERNEGKFQCPQCERKLYNPQGRAAHLRSAHGVKGKSARQLKRVK